MTLSEKLQLLRQLEGNLRGLGRALSKSELARLLQEELGQAISVAYISQLESGKRPHMTEKSRELLSRFYKVHPGYLVSDPEGYRTELTVVPEETRIDDVLSTGAYAFDADDPELAGAMRTLARHHATRELVLLMATLAREPGVLRMLRQCLSGDRESADHNGKTRKQSKRKES